MLGKIDIITTTLGKALGGASGGCVSGHAEFVGSLPAAGPAVLFSNSVPPVIVAAALKVIETRQPHDRAARQARGERLLLAPPPHRGGLRPEGGESPIVPVMLYNAKIAQEMAAHGLFAEGIYVVGFFFPVVPKGQARIRTQLSAAHEKHHLDRAIEAFVKVGDRLGVRGLGREEIAARFGL